MELEARISVLFSVIHRRIFSLCTYDINFISSLSLFLSRSLSYVRKRNRVREVRSREREVAASWLVCVVSVRETVDRHEVSGNNWSKLEETEGTAFKVCPPFSLSFSFI